MMFSRKENLRDMQFRQKQEHRQIEEYDHMSQARREALAASFEREKQVPLHACMVADCNTE